MRLFQAQIQVFFFLHSSHVPNEIELITRILMFVCFIHSNTSFDVFGIIVLLEHLVVSKFQPSCDDLWVLMLQSSLVFLFLSLLITSFI